MGFMMSLFGAHIFCHGRIVRVGLNLLVADANPRWGMLWLINFFLEPQVSFSRRH